MDVHTDYTLADDSDYTICSFCRSCLRPYHNQAITTNITNNTCTKTLIKHHHLHCEKCGLYIEVHPKHSDNMTSRIFICGNSIPHQYCLCYHCALLYGINPNQKPINSILNILNSKPDKPDKHKQQQQPKVFVKKLSNPTNPDPNSNPETNEEISDQKSENSMYNENKQGLVMIADDIHDNDDDEIKINELQHDVQEKYDNLKALQDKLNALNGSNGYHAMSCPSSPAVQALNKILGSPNLKSKNHKNKFEFTHQKSRSLKASPMLNAQTSSPSPRDLSEDLKDSQQHWQKYLLQNRAHSYSNSDKRKNENSNNNDGNIVNMSDAKLVQQQKKIEELEALKLRLEQTQSKSAQYVELLRNGKI